MLADPLEQKRRPRTIIEAKFSLPLTVALALIRPEITLDSFTKDTLDDPSVLALAARTTFSPRSDWGHDRAAAGELTLVLRDGRTLHHEISHALGEPSRPLSDQDLRSKFIDCAARAVSPVPADVAQRYFNRVMRLDHEEDAAAALLSFC